MKNKEILYLKGLEFSLQEWKKSNNISQVKYSENKYKKSSNTKIYRSTKHYSLLY
jgi:hypothetical protein